MPLLPQRPDGAAIRAAFLVDETACLVTLLPLASLSDDAAARVSGRAAQWVESVRAHHASSAGMESFLHQYDLSTQEGVLLMCVAEALLRIPDSATADRLIRDKLSRGDWQKHLGQSPSLLVNASTWGLMLTGKLTQIDNDSARDPASWYERVVARAGEPVVRIAIRQAMKLMAEQFVMGRNIGEALARSRSGDNALFRHSFDMLGESALTSADARRYHASYADAIGAIGATREPNVSVFAQPSISVKLSALHPRYEFAQRERVLTELVPAVKGLAQIAKAQGIGMTVDAEEAERLELSLEIFAVLRRDAELAGWEGLGLAVQAYQKRALPLIDWLVALATQTRTRIPVRLVKGAYWDTEIKRAQVNGLDGYPVFTRKAHTDVSYLACAHRMLAHAGENGVVFPMFATHNAHTVAAIAERASELRVSASHYEFQRLHGMGEPLYGEVTPGDKLGVACRVYAPVGSHQDLLPYLVRRLLENGANTSFVNRIADVSVPVAEIVSDPVARVRAQGGKPNATLPLPRNLFAPSRENSRGVSLADQTAMATLDDAFVSSEQQLWHATPIINGQRVDGAARNCSDPGDHRRAIGTVIDTAPSQLSDAIALAHAAQPAWDALGGHARADVLDRAAAHLDRARDELVVLLAREAGKARADAIGEVREAVDFCRYYAVLAREHFSHHRYRCRRRPASPMSLRCTAAACSPASVPGIFRWRSTSDRSPRRSPQAMPSSPSLLNKRR